MSNQKQTFYFLSRYFISISLGTGIILSILAGSAHNKIINVSPEFFAPVVPPDSNEKTNLPYPMKDREGNFIEEQNKNPFYLEDPANVKKDVEFDPESNQYIITESIGKDYYRNPTYMSMDEFLDKEYKRSNQDYFRQRENANSLLSRKNSLPQLNVPAKAFERLFGGTNIDIRPQGNIDLTFGSRYTKTFNPLLTKRQQKQTVPEFDMNIQMNVIGKIGEKLKIITSYNTQATFDFENQLKVEYTGFEDEIIKKIEAGNVSFPLRTSLITGTQSLWGIKTQLQFGRLTMTSLLSQQKGQTKEINIQNGAMTQDFSIQADQYEENRHFFLAQYFRNSFNDALTNLPTIKSGINITKIEVWATAIGTVKDARDVLAFMDMAEDSPYARPTIQPSANKLPYAYYIHPERYSNNLYQKLISDSSLRDKNLVIEKLKKSPYNLVPDRDFQKYRAKLLSSSEYTFNPQLGYISLNQSLDPTYVLAVAFQYTYNGETYQVGEFAQDIPSDKIPFLKMLKSSFINPRLPLWDLMMKNVYSLGAYQVNQEDFRLDVYYTVPSAGETRYMPAGPPGVKDVLFLRLMGLDRLNSQHDATPDGVFDFIPGVTILPANGKIIFPVVEPFGRDLKKKFGLDTVTANIYSVNVLYDSTKTTAQQFPNRYTIKGKYKSSVSSEISLGTFNLPQGSVKVTAGGQVLRENIDYTVDYNIGRIKIINEGIFNSGVPIKVSFENNALFGFQSKTLMGTRFDYWINDNFTLGGTVMKLSEKPLTKKVNMGDEPIVNTIWGVDANYHTETPWLTKAIDKLPLYQTKEMSSVTFSGEYAQLHPGHSRAIEQGQDPTTYIDDFEGTKSSYDLKFPSTSWVLSSTPSQAGANGQNLFPESEYSDSLPYGYNRAKLAWYNIDPLYFKQTQNSVYTKQVLQKQVFPKKTNEPGQSFLTTLDLAYYPKERGPYNYDFQNVNNDGSLKNPDKRWGGIMRKLETTDFEGANIEFLEFWVMDPFRYNQNNKGELFINLGNVSEDVLKDGKMFYENGLPKDDDPAKVDTSIWGLVPKLEPITYSFDNETSVRIKQDVGFDGLSNDKEASFFASFLNNVRGNVSASVYDALRQDPSSDNFIYHQDVGGDVLNRYKNINGAEGNSTNSSKSSTNVPESEDLNRDNTLVESENYFQYRINLDPSKLVVGENYITDKQKGTWDDGDTVNWYQFKIPVTEFEKSIGNIEDFKSIRFIRMFLTGFSEDVVCRFARLELTRNQWRRYQYPLLEKNMYVNEDGVEKSSFNISSVSIEENANRDPVNYVIPPGIERNQVVGSVSNTLENERGLSMQICNLENGHARAAFKTLNIDIRNFKELKMFVHAESVEGQEPLKDGDITAFIRIGSDFTENYYEYEVPLQITSPGSTDASVVWPAGNEMDFLLKDFTELKQERNRAGFSFDKEYWKLDSKGNKIKVLGSPDMGKLKTAMIGVRNPTANFGEHIDDGRNKCAEVWFNELRMSGFDEKGGWAALGRMDVKLADLGNVTVAGSIRTIGFGSLEQRVAERSKENIYQYDASTNLELGKFIPKKIGIRLPMYAGISESFSNPKYDPYETDVLLKDKINGLSKTEGDSIKKTAQDYNSVKSINFTNVKKERTSATARPHFYDIENVSLSFAYSRKYRRTPTIEHNLRKEYTGGLAYAYSIKPAYRSPLENIISAKMKILRLLREFNLNVRPSDISFRTDLNRQYEEFRLRSLTMGEQNETYYPKQFTWGRYYGLRYSPFKSVTVDFNATNTSRIDEPDGKINTQEKKDSIWKNIKKFGRTTNYNQSFTVNYNLPFNKIGILDWMTVTARYGATYDWTAASLVNDTLHPSELITKIDNTLGHTITNSQNKQLNGDLNMKNFYNKFKYLRKYNSPSGAPPPPSSKPKNTSDSAKIIKPKINYPKGIEGFFVKTLISLKKISANYSIDKRTVLPGFKARSKYLGAADSLFNAPGYDFVFGRQPDEKWFQKAGERNWITPDTNLNTQVMQSITRNLNIKANIEWLNDIRLDLTFMRMKTSSISRYFKNTGTQEAPVFSLLKPLENGSFSISYFSLWTLLEFKKKDEVSAYFNKFEENTKVISKRLAEKKSNSQNKNFPDNSEYRYGYGPYSQDVLIPAFLAAYSKKSASSQSLDPFIKIPKPNWRFTYAGLSKLPFFKKYFTQVNLTNSYNSTYSVGGYSTNLNFDEQNPFALDSNSHNYISEKTIPGVTITESLGPLAGLDMTLKNNMTLKVDFKVGRTLNMSFINYQMNESKNIEFAVGVGYRMKGLPFAVRVKGKKKKLDNDLNFKFDASYRNTKTTIYKLYQDIAEPTGGQRTLSISPSLDYVVSNQLTIRIFYDRRDNFPVTSSSFKTVNANMGVMVRFTLTQ